MGTSDTVKPVKPATNSKSISEQIKEKMDKAKKEADKAKKDLKEKADKAAKDLKKKMDKAAKDLKKRWIRQKKILLNDLIHFILYKLMTKPPLILIQRQIPLTCQYLLKLKIIK